MNRNTNKETKNSMEYDNNNIPSTRIKLLIMDFKISSFFFL